MACIKLDITQDRMSGDSGYRTGVTHNMTNVNTEI